MLLPCIALFHKEMKVFGICLYSVKGTTVWVLKQSFTKMKQALNPQSQV